MLSMRIQRHTHVQRNMSEPHTGKRIRVRLGLKLPVRVHCRESPDLEWVEITRLLDVTPFGCGFTLRHVIEKGRLVHMTIPMPRQLRVFDHVEDQYKIWALVRYVRPLPPEDEKAPGFEVGVAFVGKRPPKSYGEDPAKRYDIAVSVLEQGPGDDSEEMLAPLRSTQREYTRHSIPVEILLEALDENGVVVQSENTVTETISPKGASLFTSLTIAEGRFVRLTSKQYNLTVFAAVRSSRKGADGIGRIHVEFSDQKWPL